MESKNIVSLHIGRPQIRKYNTILMKTAIAKQAAQTVYLTSNGFVGDGQANLKFHGGPERAVCFYPFEHYSHWERAFKRSLSIPGFGENVTITGMMEENIYIGDVFSMGDAIVQITQGRIPCATISMQNNIAELLKRVLDTGYTGYFAKVLKEGSIEQDSAISLLERPQETVSVMYANLVMFHKKDGIEGVKAVIQAKGLANDWMNRLQKRLEKYQ